jgi:uncharacterized membrane protein YgcG
MTSETPKFRWRAFTSVLIALSFVVLALTGAMLFVSPPGRVANWTNWTLLGLTKHQWIGLHVWFSATFLAVSIVHLLFNWRPLLGYFKDRLTRRVGFRLEWVAALAVSAFVFIGTRQGWPPFSSLLSFSEQVKESWEKPQARAPIPHAELLTLAELAQKAGVDLATATNRLAAKGVQGATPDLVVQQLADQNRRSAQQIYEAILSPPERQGAGHGGGQGRGGQGGGQGGGPGGGAGRKTLSQFCADEGIDLSDAMRRLEGKSIKASTDQTMREIAVNNGFDRPYELLELIRAKKRQP